MQDLFRKFANRTTQWTASPAAFLSALGIVAVWFGVGCVVGFTDTIQLVINTGTTIVTFLVVFLIQNTQNRDAQAIQLKLDELIRSSAGARDGLVNLENCSDEELQRLQEAFERLRKQNPADVA